MSVIFLHSTLDTDSYPSISLSFNGTSADASYPLTNLQDQYKTTLTKSANTNQDQEWRIDLGANYSIDSVAIVNHNFTSVAADAVNLEYDANNNGAWSASNVITALTGADSGIIYFPFQGALSKRYWRLFFDDTAALSAIPYIGQIFLGTKFTHAYEFTKGGSPNTPSYDVITQRSWDGTTSGYLKHSNKTRVWGNITFQIITSAYKTNFDTWFDSVKGGYRPFLMSTDSGTTWYYVRVVENQLPYVEVAADYWRVTLNFIEQIG